jgi:hypothetical protein
MENCGCVYEGMDSFDMPTVAKATDPIARKEYVCCECRHVIKKGERYRRDEGVWEDSWVTYKTCRICLEIREVFFCEGYQYGTLLEDLKQYLLDFGDELPHEKIRELDDKAKARVLELVDKIYEGGD